MNFYNFQIYFKRIFYNFETKLKQPVSDSMLQRKITIHSSKSYGKFRSDEHHVDLEIIDAAHTSPFVPSLSAFVAFAWKHSSHAITSWIFKIFVSLFSPLFLWIFAGRKGIRTLRLERARKSRRRSVRYT